MPKLSGVEPQKPVQPIKQKQVIARKERNSNTGKNRFKLPFRMNDKILQQATRK
jgi:hypothetical protein